MRVTSVRRKSKNERLKPSGFSCRWRAGQRLIALLRDRGISLRALRLLADTGLDSNETSYPSDHRGDAGILGLGAIAVDADATGWRTGAPEPPALRARPRSQETLAKAGEVQRALRDAEHEIRHAVDKTHDEVHRAIDEVRGGVARER